MENIISYKEQNTVFQEDLIRQIVDSVIQDILKDSVIQDIVKELFEKLMFKRLYEYLDNLNTFYPLQSEFREKHSTNHALISMTESIKTTIDNGNYGSGVFTDLKRSI